MSGTLAKKREHPARGARRGRPRRPPAPAAGAAPTTGSAERIIFPIRDQNGGAVGPRRPVPHPGRRADRGPDARDHGPKYLNSPATALFDKSRTLYLIDRAKGPIRKGGQAVIVEGYTDALMAHQAGFDNVVASLGTALTPGQVALAGPLRQADRPRLRRRPGGPERRHVRGHRAQRAHRRGPGRPERPDAGIGLVDVGVVRLPEGKDPDEVIREQPDLWREATRTPVQVMEYLINYHAAQVDVRTPEGKERLVAAVLPTLRRVGNPTVRDAYLRLLAQRSTVEERTLLEQLHQAPRASGRACPAGRWPGRPATASRRPIMAASGSRSRRSARPRSR